MNTPRSCYTSIREGFLEEVSSELGQPSWNSRAGLRDGGPSTQDGTRVRGVGGTAEVWGCIACAELSLRRRPQPGGEVSGFARASLGQDVCVATPGGGSGNCGRPRRRRPRTACAYLGGQVRAEHPARSWSRNQEHLRIQTCKDDMVCLSLTSSGSGAFAFSTSAGRKAQLR